MKSHIQSTLYTPIILLADNNAVDEYQAPVPPATSADAVKTFSRAVQESHPGAWDGKFYTAPHDGLLLVNAQVACLGVDNGGEDRSVSLFVTRARGGVPVHVGFALATLNQPLTTVFPVEKGDVIWVQWIIEGGFTATGDPTFTRLAISEI